MTEIARGPRINQGSLVDLIPNVVVIFKATARDSFPLTHGSVGRLLLLPAYTHAILFQRLAIQRVFPSLQSKWDIFTRCVTKSTH